MKKLLALEQVFEYNKQVLGCCAVGSAPALGAGGHSWKTSYPGLAQLVARVVWDHQVGSSSLPSRTKGAEFL